MILRLFVELLTKLHDIDTTLLANMHDSKQKQEIQLVRTIESGGLLGCKCENFQIIKNCLNELLRSVIPCLPDTLSKN